MSNEDFKRLSENELQQLSSDGLINHIRSATDAGDPGQAQAALAVLCYRHFADVRRRISLRVPPEDVEDQAMVVILAAIKSAFEGTSVGEFRVWLNRIIDRRGIADYHRSREDKPKPGPLPTEHQDDEEVWGEEPAAADESGRVIVQTVIDQCLEPLSEPHRAVVELNVFEDRDAADTTSKVNARHPDLDTEMSTDNVHKIVSRFRKCVSAKLEET